jgi:hypothetical protein
MHHCIDLAEQVAMGTGDSSAIRSSRAARGSASNLLNDKAPAGVQGFVSSLGGITVASFTY